jgi:hypothetical protein
MLTTILDAVALALVVVGVALLSVPAALIVAGIGVGVASYVIAGRS